MIKPTLPTQATIARAIKAARAAGVEVAEICITSDGSIRVLIGQPRRDTPNNEWDA